MASWSEDNHMRLNTIKTQHMIISKKQQSSLQQFIATLNDINLKRVDKYDYLSIVLNKGMNYDTQWEVTTSKTNPHIYLLKKTRRMSFMEDKLVCIYKSLTLSQSTSTSSYIYGAPLLASASTRAKKEMQAQQRRFLNVIGLSTERVHVHNIKPMADFLNEQCANIVQRILKGPNHPITTSIHRNKYNNTSSCRALTSHSTKTRSCRRASASFAMGTSINTRTQDDHSSISRRDPSVTP
jgi:hypothetical protein